MCVRARSASQIITIDEAKRRQSFGSCDGDLPADVLPLLSDTSDLLQDTHIEKVFSLFFFPIIYSLNCQNEASSRPEASLTMR